MVDTPYRLEDNEKRIKKLATLFPPTQNNIPVKNTLTNVKENKNRIRAVNPMKTYDVSGEPIALDRTSPIVKGLSNLKATAEHRRDVSDPKKAFAAKAPNIESPATVPIEQTNRELMKQSNDYLMPAGTPSKLREINQPGGIVKITSGPRKGMTFTAPASGGQIKAYDPQGNLTNLSYSDEVGTRNLSNLSETGAVNKSIPGYSIKQDGASNEEMDRFMAGGGGSRILAGGRNARTIQGGRPAPQDDRKAKLWEIATTSKFPKQRQTAMEGLKMLQSGEQFETTTGESQRQFGVQEKRLSGRDTMLSQQGAERLDIDQQRAQTDADYKKYLANKPDTGSSLNRNQWMTQNRNVLSDYQKRFSVEKDPTFATDPRNFLGEGKQMDHRTLLHRDDPQAARELYGAPDNQTKALLDLNMNPERWAAYNAASPEQKQQMIANLITQRNY